MIVGVVYGVSNIFFTFSVYHTSTANLVFITLPSFDAGSRACMVAHIWRASVCHGFGLQFSATLVGLLIIVSGGLASGTG
ncbi:MAG: hypothetical protein R3D29_08065 [Nitratireductor sp.]